jgi:hypothetical protein
MNYKDGQEVNFFFLRDYYSENDFKDHRIVYDQNNVQFDYWRNNSTSWPSPVKGQEIKCKVKRIYDNGIVRLEELNVDYWTIGEFEKGQMLDLEFFEDYTNVKGERHRVSIDHSGRKFDYRIDEMAIANPEFGQTITCCIDKITKKGYPMVLEKSSNKTPRYEIYEIDQLLMLEVLEEFDRSENGKIKGYRKLIDRQHNNKLTVPRAPFQIGGKYIPNKKGDVIKYRVKKIRDDGSFLFWEEEISNSYYLNIIDFPDNVVSFYNRNKISHFLSVKSQLTEKNPYWVWTFLNSLHDYKEDRLRLSNFVEVVEILKIIKSTINKILESGFLTTFSNDIRQDRKVSLNNQIKKIDTIQRAIDLVDSNNFSKDIKVLIDHLKAKDEEALNVTEFILRYLDEFIPNTDVEDLINAVKSGNNDSDLKCILHSLDSRKKRIRSKLFANESILAKNKLEKNLDLAHIILIEKTRILATSEGESVAENKLIQADILRYEGFFYNDTDKVNQSIQLLEEKIHVKELLPDFVRRDRWFKDVNFSLSQNYRFLAKSTKNTSKTIEFLNKSFENASKLKSFSSYIDKGLIRFYEMILLLEGTTDISLVKKRANEMYKLYSQSDKKRLNSRESFLNELVDMFDIVRSIENDKISDKEKLLAYTHKENKTNYLNNKSLSAFILADILLRNFSDIKLISKLKDVLLEGSLNIKNKSLMSDAEDVVALEKEVEERKIKQEINSVETQILEHKATYMLSVDPYLADKDKHKIVLCMENEVLKSIAGMLNSNDGGSVFVGVLEMLPKYRSAFYSNALLNKFQGIDLGDVMILGLENELDEINNLNNKDWRLDEYIASIQSLIENNIDHNASSMVEFKTHTIENKTILRIIVKPSQFRSEGWIVSNKGKETLYVRCNNETKSFVGAKEIIQKLISIKG